MKVIHYSKVVNSVLSIMAIEIPGGKRNLNMNISDFKCIHNKQFKFI